MTQNWSIKTAEGRAYRLSKSYVPPVLRSQLESATLLLLPVEGYRDFDGPLYPVGTEDFLMSLGGQSGLSVDVVVADEDYKELALHSDWLVLAGVFIGTSMVVPIVVNLISEHVKRKLWPDESTRGLKVRLVLEQTVGDTTQCVEVSYEGPAKEFQGTMRDALSDLRGRGFHIPDETPEQPLLPARELLSPDTEQEGCAVRIGQGEGVDEEGEPM